METAVILSLFNHFFSSNIGIGIVIFGAIVALFAFFWIFVLKKIINNK